MSKKNLTPIINENNCDSRYLCKSKFLFWNLISEAPYNNGHEKNRFDWARADHADDIIYIGGAPFDPEMELPHGRYFSDEEKALSKRMMSGKD